MLHTLVKTTPMPTHVTRPSMSRADLAFFNPSRPLLPLMQSQPLRFNRRLLLVNLSNRRFISSAQSLNGIPSVDIGNELGKGGFLELELKVRDYEVDHYGVVNNAVYSSYCQHAHHEILEILGLNLEAHGRKQPLAVTELSFKFIAPLRNREKFILKVRVAHSSVARICFEHFIYRLPNYEPILEAKSTVVFLDENHRLRRIPPLVKYNLTQLGLYK